MLTGGKSRDLQDAYGVLKDWLRVALKDLLRVALKDWLRFALKDLLRVGKGTASAAEQVPPGMCRRIARYYPGPKGPGQLVRGDYS